MASGAYASTAPDFADDNMFGYSDFGVHVDPGENRRHSPPHLTMAVTSSEGADVDVLASLSPLAALIGVWIGGQLTLKHSEHRGNGPTSNIGATRGRQCIRSF
jgi:hypothetical protein